MGFLHTSTEVRLSASSDRHHNMDLHYEVLLWSRIGFFRRTSLPSKEQQNSGFLLDTSSLKAAYLHLCIFTEPEDHGLHLQTLFCFTFWGMSCLLTVFLPLVKSIYHSPVSPPSFLNSYQKVILQWEKWSVREEKRKDAKNRTEGEMKNENGRFLGKEVQTN